ncbi:hypothetical protein P3T76_011224 [Phytophthora citrophthora]|uniref:Uncharacterized protein n=1 Tax=Phytophthora citrophthora TaxID=4793 RepID=A0AAD9GA57_9STRA|nr:hypothetical protein P3T76_011224 [Phytophthora citrophthora]
MRPAGIVVGHGFTKAITKRLSPKRDNENPWSIVRGPINYPGNTSKQRRVRLFLASSEKWISMKFESLTGFTIHYVDTCFDMNSRFSLPFASAMEIRLQANCWAIFRGGSIPRNMEPQMLLKLAGNWMLLTYRVQHILFM